MGVDVTIINSFVACMVINIWILYCRSSGKISCNKLPQWSDVLHLHTARANYEAGVWRESLVQKQ